MAEIVLYTAILCVGLGMIAGAVVMAVRNRLRGNEQAQRERLR